VPEGPVLQQGREKGSGVAVITDEFMRQMRAKARLYSLVMPRRAARHSEPEAGAVIWKHRRRSHSLRADGVLAIVCPVADNTERAGIGILYKPPEEAAQIMDEDLAVQAGVLSYEVHAVHGSFGDSLPPGQGGGR
jgi:hypothetical protein